MANSYVTSAKLTGGKMKFSVIVDDFEANEYVEISGSATQSGGAFASIYELAKVPAKANNANGESSVDVTAVPLPPWEFRKDQDVTVVIRVAKVWVTVLAEESTQLSPQQIRAMSEPSWQWQPPEGQAQVAHDGTKWNQVKEVSEIHGDPPPKKGGTSY